MSDVYNLKPINKTAALVTGQSGCASDSTLSNEQLRENLVRQWQVLYDDIKNHHKKSQKRKEIGRSMHIIQNKINAIRPARKAKGVEHYFIDAARINLTKPQFDILMKNAVAMMKGGTQS